MRITDPLSHHQTGARSRVGLKEARHTSISKTGGFFFLRPGAVALTSRKIMSEGIAHQTLFRMKISSFLLLHDHDNPVLPSSGSRFGLYYLIPRPANICMHIHKWSESQIHVLLRCLTIGSCLIAKIADLAAPHAEQSPLTRGRVLQNI